ncbi:hypothetical protein PV10_07074 [Exophiala mesophila]|uniref:Histidinol-phosphatase n=1 Tax=Exophiala mesophila TaxID=212818 RepID=A0A0D1Z719_EXOME|nr:uncharacterized protein PV10_07074 [Exophiala mesophila]KIV89694.1 hypothetical protein PV10_07074 [Exophiala mesophila]
MPFSHHSHSGQFCPGHAQDSLESIIQAAISKKMQMLALTEHMPRHEIDRYPEELSAGTTLDAMTENERAYVREATLLRDRYRGQIELAVGFESDWIRPESVQLIDQSISTHAYDLFVGSVHHVHTIPIDYDRVMYEDARQQAGGTDEKLFESYFDAQLDMLQATKPPVVGHFDLIRLKSDCPNPSFPQFPGVWERIARNLDFIASYGGILELNFAAVRKGLLEPYPVSDICQAASKRNIRFCLSDDSHGIDHLAHSYDHVLPFLRKNSIRSLTVLGSNADGGNYGDRRFPTLEAREVDVDILEKHPFFQHA